MINGQVENRYSRKPLVAHLNSCQGKTLGELDVANVFARAIDKPKITGIAGDVIEQSVLSLSANSRQEPDIEVDGVKYEVKTTGIQKSKKGGGFEAKEPMSVTAVSPKKIVNEEYFDSSFWHKVEHILFFYYHYNSSTKVDAIDYANFPLVSFQFHEYSDFSEEEQEILKNDWEQVRNFIRFLQQHYKERCEDHYPRISSELREGLMLLDTAPKWPNPPRFRFKRTFVTNILRKHLSKKKLEPLKVKISSRRDLDERCLELERRYKGMTVGELCSLFGIKVSKELKSITEPIIIKMFGGTSKKMQKVDFFNKVGCFGKSFVITKKGGRTEDAKFFTIDFTEFYNEKLAFEDSQFYEFFSSVKILVALFEEPSMKAPLIENKFLGFRLITFNDDFIFSEVKKVWLQIRDLVQNNKLRDVPVVDKKGCQIINKNGEKRSAPNFPKSSEGIVFIRGTGTDSSYKRKTVNGVKMYSQQVWVRGDYFAKLLLAPANNLG